MSRRKPTIDVDEDDFEGDGMVKIPITWLEQITSLVRTTEEQNAKLALIQDNNFTGLRSALESTVKALDLAYKRIDALNMRVACLAGNGNKCIDVTAETEVVEATQTEAPRRRTRRK